MAERLAREGAKVVISSRKAENVQRAVNDLNAKGLKNVCGIKCHVSNADDRHNLYKKALDSFGKIDILVSNAAVNPTVGSVLECSEESWDKIFDVNVKAAYLLAKEVTPILQEQKTGGSIIFMSSYAGLNPFPVRSDHFIRCFIVHRQICLFLVARRILGEQNSAVRINQSHQSRHSR